MNDTPEIAVVSAYFGSLPSYFPAWLSSCELNSDIKWFFFSDQSLDEVDFPPNVIPLNLRLDEVKKIFASFLGGEVVLNRPYKLCDFRPFYWMLLDYMDVSYSHWGHCDIDMVFGQINRFLDKDLLETYERIFELGCFSLYKNSCIAKSMAFDPSNGMDWKTVISHPESFGFDEHNGVNLSWSRFPEIWYRSSNDIFDAEPRIAGFASAQGTFGVRPSEIWREADGLFIRERSVLGSEVQRELMAVHFQKRSMLYDPQLRPGDSFHILPDRIAAIDSNIPVSALYPAPSFSERWFLARNKIRKSRMGKCLRRGTKLWG
jgi:hypothetical protein